MARSQAAAIYLLLLAALSTCSVAAVPEVYITSGMETTNLSSSGIQITPGLVTEGCGFPHRRAVLLEDALQKQLRVDLKHRGTESRGKTGQKSLLLQSLKRDSARLAEFRKKISQKALKSNPEAHLYSMNSSFLKNSGSNSDESLEVQSTVASGASLGAGEYFMDVLVGSPPEHYSLIIDTGSDLTWLQCDPCQDCYKQAGPVFDPSKSASYKPIDCESPACELVTHYNCPEDEHSSTGKNAKCRYLYSYGDSSQTSGDLALETLSISLASKEQPNKSLEIRDMIFGCGHSNKGLFQGAGGLLGLGQGPLSFSSQLKSSPIGHGFSYCLVDRSSNLSVSSVISFGDDFALSRHFDSMRFTPLVRTNSSIDTFYYLGIRGLKISNETLKIPADRFAVAENGSGGTIIDSGTTLTYLDPEAYQAVKSAFVSKIAYPRSDPFDVLEICYNTSSAAASAAISFPAFSIEFTNGEELHLPQSNYFIQPDPDEAIHCLAMLPATGLSIIGNFQQQNIHLLYDLENSRLGFANTDCALL